MAIRRLALRGRLKPLQINDHARKAGLDPQTGPSEPIETLELLDLRFEI